MVELAYTADLKSAAARLVGSSPTGGTNIQAPAVPIAGEQGPSFLRAAPRRGAKDSHCHRMLGKTFKNIAQRVVFPRKIGQYHPSD